MSHKSSLSSDELVSAAIRLLELLSAAPGGRLSRTEAAAGAGVDADDLPALTDVLSALADRESGARAVVLLTNDGVALEGDAASLQPIRLSPTEGAALAHVLSVVRMDAAARDRIARALLPLGLDPEQTGAGEALAEPARFGSFFPQLVTCVDDGVRVRLSYRSAHAEEPRERTVDPLALTVEDGAAYLIAWDVDRDAQRRYRLDRISALGETGDSVERHPWRREDIGRSLTAGARAELSFPDAAYARNLAWPGLGKIGEPDPCDGRVRATVLYGQEGWLFDQVLAGGGEIVIEKPAALRERFVVRARALLNERREPTGTDGRAESRA